MKTSQKKIQDVGKIKEVLRGPLSVGIEITNKCNFHCPYCYNERCNSTDMIDMKVDDFIKIISILKRVGAFFISISGGEPLCHNDFVNICKALKKSKLVSTLITNGYLIKNYIGIVNNTFNKVYISIDGPEDIHNKIRGENSFQVITKSLGRIKIRKVMCTTLTKLNIGYLEENIRIAMKYKFDAICFFVFKPMGEGLKNRNLLALDNYTLEEIDNKLTNLRNRFNIKITYVNPSSEICYAGKYLIYILPDGRVKPCAFSNFVIGNILYGNWNKLWKKCQLCPTTCHAF